MEWTWDDLTITDEAERIDVDALCGWLAGSYWAAERSRATILRSIAGSVCLSAFAGGKQVGFLRAITDGATFSWICDVIVDEAHRGRGVGKRLVAAAVEHPTLKDTHMGLGTRDAHGLYEQYGFVRREAMVRRIGGTAG
ncbi:GNAT family N-acetyltransferase [Paenibacillus sp.]|uniref:GNAT family N-acetyltransferase n=1 Tax=Paenibacillus sp. TaxID=58172 RepID=UPI002D3F4A11|nr:GNAT family N-acetyltransferase [Paenibacillus sp.]HZG85180.1 GNAT family N-acetyltransferase [Paenibacillus sp.]